jgi:hypothetical protein
MDAWKAARVAEWLAEQGLGSQVSSRALENDVDGATLLELDSDGWRELGVDSAVRRAKLISLVRRACAPEDTEAEPGANKYDHVPYSTLTKHGEHFFGAVEHLPEWHSAVGHANVSGANAKNHVLGFLGMYNVLALLVFTIAFTCLFTIGDITECARCPRAARYCTAAPLPRLTASLARLAYPPRLPASLACHMLTENSASSHVCAGGSTPSFSSSTPPLPSAPSSA